MASDPQSPGGESPTRILPAGQAATPQAIGEYRVRRLLGEGGMGAVLLCDDAALGRQVAIKVIRRELVPNTTFLERFKREARLCAAINHPNIVTTYAVGSHEGSPYLVLEYVEGVTLRDRLRTPPPVSAADVLEVLRQVCEGMVVAAARGIVHRDIKPTNIMIRPDGLVKLMDFGLSKSLEPDGLTITNTVLGTPEYMSPEQARGEDVDFRTDIYALGITLFQCLAGYLPFTGSSVVAVAMKHANEPLPQDPTLRNLAEGRVWDLVCRMTQKQKESRPSGFLEIRDELQALVTTLRSRSLPQPALQVSVEPTPPRPAPGAPPTPPRPPRQAAPATAAPHPFATLPGEAPGSAARATPRSARPSGERKVPGLALVACGVLAVAGLAAGAVFLAGGFQATATPPAANAPARETSPTPPGGGATTVAIPRTSMVALRTRTSGGTLSDVAASLQAAGFAFSLDLRGKSPDSLKLACNFSDRPPAEVLDVVALALGLRVEKRATLTVLVDAGDSASMLVRSSRMALTAAGLPRGELHTLGGDVTLRQALDVLHTTSSVDFIIAGPDLPGRKLPPLSLGSRPLPDVLNALMDAGVPMEWAFVRNTIVVVPIGG